MYAFHMAKAYPASSVTVEHTCTVTRHCKAKIVMNSKGEWNGSRIPRVVVEVADKIQDEKNEE